MYIADILKNIVELSKKNPNETLIVLFQESFSETNPKELLLLRAKIITELDSTANRLGDTHIPYIRETLDEVYDFLSFYDLSKRHTDSSVPQIRYSHVSAVHSLLELDDKNTKSIIKNTEELQELNTELKQLILEEELEDDIRETMENISEDIDNSIAEAKVVGDKSFKDLQVKLVGRIGILGKKIESIKDSKISKKLKQIFDVVSKFNKIVAEFKQLPENTLLLLDQIKNISG